MNQKNMNHKPSDPTTSALSLWQQINNSTLFRFLLLFACGWAGVQLIAYFWRDCDFYGSSDYGHIAELPCALVIALFASGDRDHDYTAGDEHDSGYVGHPARARAD
jgi:hypothetical protein